MLEGLWDGVDDLDDLDEWFREPWRDGRNAMKVCVELALDERPSRDGVKAISFLIDKFECDRSTLTSVEYETADGIRYELSRSESASSADLLLENALSIFMNWLANSDGGGHVPNNYLRCAIWALMQRDDAYDRIRKLVGKHRALDRGLRWPPENAKDAAFRWFWLNRRYRLAFLVR